MKTTTKTLTLAALLLIMGQSAAFSMDADTIDVKTDSVKVQKKTDKKNESGDGSLNRPMYPTENDILTQLFNK